MFPIAWLLDQVGISLFYYQALDDVQVLQFSKPDFDTLILNDPIALKSLFSDLSRDYSASMFRINGLEQSRRSGQNIYRPRRGRCNRNAHERQPLGHLLRHVSR